MNREEMDAIAWRIMHEQAAFEGEPAGLERSHRPCNYAELGELTERRRHKDDFCFEHAWSEFLHEFCRYRSATFFSNEPPVNMSPGRRAWLAGVAEYLCLDFGLPVPAWTSKSEYYLADEYEPSSELVPYFVTEGEARDLLRAKTHPVFLRRKVLFDVRGLTTV